jgi:DNA polymerase-3 subunit delta'
MTPPFLGHSTLRHALLGALTEGRLHHALLFEGSEGVGRTTLARWLMARANCAAASGLEPCGVCSACRRIEAGTHPDMHLVTPEGSSIQVARIREVVRALGYHRHDATHRFVVIEPAEAMAAPASNALLKTLEEPPPDTHFILIARHASGLLPTIVSRCQRHRLAPVDDDTLAAWLTAQGIDDVTRRVRAAEGAPGRALALSAEVLADTDAVRDRLLAALSGDLSSIFDLAEQLTEGKGAERRAGGARALDLLEEWMADVVRLAASPPIALRHEAIRPRLEAWHGALWPRGVERCVASLADARAALAANVAPRTVLDALLTAVATELGNARSAPSSAPVTRSEPT